VNAAYVLTLESFQGRSLADFAIAFRSEQMDLEGAKGLS
jgi:hypothetical protein